MLFCKLRGVAIFDVCFFRVGNPAGYVIHEEVEDFTSTFWIAMGPLVINTTLCLAFCLPALIPTRIFGIAHPLSYFWMWLGISIGMHAFPSTHDARALWTQAKRAARQLRPLAVLSLPLAIVIVGGNVLSVIWFDALYAFAVGFLLPERILRWVAS